jgi:glycine dehydrogenase
MSFPVAGTLMVEPTESESLAELDRFCEAMLAIRAEIAEIEAGRVALGDSGLRHAPHTARAVTAPAWDRPYSRRQAAYPWLDPGPGVAPAASGAGDGAGGTDAAAVARRAEAASRVARKYWPPVSRIDNAYGDRNLTCSCPPLEALAEPQD